MQRDILTGVVRHHWVSALLVLITLITIGAFAFLSWYFKRRWKKLLAESMDDEPELELLSPLNAKDREAIDLIKRLRKQVWELPDGELQLSIEALSQRAIRVVRSVATIYHDNMTAPELEASLLQSLQLVKRVTIRVIRLANLHPFRFLGNQKLSDYQRFYQVYKKINDNPVLQILKRHRHLYRFARWAVALKNLGNPLYWAGRELSKEGYFFMLRWFYLAFIGQVGREAMKLYGGHHFQREEDRDAIKICYRLFALTERWGGPYPGEWTFMVYFITHQIALEPDIKLHILAGCAKRSYPKDLSQYILQTEAGKKWYREGLNGLLKQEPHLAERSIAIQQELSRMDSDALPRQNG